MARKQFKLYSLLAVFGLCLMGMDAHGQRPSRPKGKGKATHMLKGQVLDQISDVELEYATVSIYKGERLLSGTVTNERGEFALQVFPGVYRLRVEYLAYGSKTLDSIRVAKEERIKDLGSIYLSADAKTLEEIEVVREKSQVQLSLDKKIYNVGKDINSRSGTADDVLDNIPSVTVDLEGNVSLRGSQNVRILIDGRPSGAAVRGTNILKTIQASQIERIEVITNPSARYEAEGTAGILNIILKKNRKKGLNGSFDVITGLPLLAGAGINLNYRKGKVNWFTNLGARYRTSTGSGYRDQRFLDSSEPARTIQKRDMDRTGWSTNLQLGLEYFINDRNLIRTSFGGELADEQNETILRFEEYDALGGFYDLDIRTDDEQEDETEIEYNLSYEHRFKKEGHQLSVDFQYEDSREEEFSGFNEQGFDGNEVATGSPNLQRNFIDEGEQRYVFKVDYNYPFHKEGRLEIGYRGSLRDITNQFKVEDFIEGTGWIESTNFTNDLLYDENIHAGYIQAGDKINRFSFLGGLRIEHSDISTDLLLTGEKNPRSYTQFFPSAFLTYEINDKNSVQISYSRRLRRPRFFELNPFITFSDNRNIFKGNPNLDPENTDSYELSHIAYLSFMTLTSSIYYRRTTDVIQRITRINSNRTSTFQPENIGQRDAYGLEFTFNSSITDWWKLNGDINFFRFDLEGQYEDQVFDTQDETINSRVSSNVSIAKKYDVQLRARYRGPTSTAQGHRDAMVMVDLGASTDILQGNGTITLNVRDLFNSRRRKGQTVGEGFIIDSEFQWMSRQATVSFNYRLNQRKKRGPSNNGSFQGGEGEF